MTGQRYEPGAVHFMHSTLKVHVTHKGAVQGQGIVSLQTFLKQKLSSVRLIMQA